MSKFEILDAESPLAKFNELLGSVSSAEIAQWKHHPCTQALLYGLLHSETVLMENWKQGNYTLEGVEGTAQKNAQVLGQLESIDLIKKYILEEISPYDQDERPQSSY